MSTKHDAVDDLLRILDDLDALVSGAKQIPLSSSVRLSREEALDLIDAAREAVPHAVHQADRIMADAREVVRQGQEEADALIARAHEEAERLVSSHEIVALANARADEIVQAAEEQAERRRTGADEYALDTLTTLNEHVEEVNWQITRGIEVLQERLGVDPHEGEEALIDPVTGRAVVPEASDVRASRVSRRAATWSVDPDSASAHM